MKLGDNKVLPYIVLGALAAWVICALCPDTAYAAGGGFGWSASDMASQQGVSPNADAFSTDALANGIKSAVTAFCGIAVVVFVFRVVLTAVNRMVLGDGPTMLTDIKFVGAYNSDLKWGDIAKHFAVQLAIVAGVWIAINIITGLVLLLFSAAP